nr:MAG TPA: hypothetical protein [Caudoviricetes sp.]
MLQILRFQPLVNILMVDNSVFYHNIIPGS